MPHVEANGVRQHYTIEGPPDASLVAFSNSLGTNTRMWDPQIPTLRTRYRVLRYDSRGHGDSSSPAGPYTIAQLAADFMALLDALGMSHCCFCGLSMGGMIGLWLAVNYPSRVKALVVANSAARIGTADTWNRRIAEVQEDGMHSVARNVIARWFTSGFRAQHPDTVASLQEMLETTDPRGYTACCGAIRDMDQRAAISTVAVPTLIISGASDPVTPPSEGEALAASIVGAKHVKLPAAHLSNVECPKEFNSALLSFFKESYA